MGGRVSKAVPDGTYPAYNIQPPQPLPKKSFTSWAAAPQQKRGGFNYPPPPPPPTLKSGQLTAIRSSAKWKTYFEASRSSNKLIVVDFTATWCGPCRRIEPTLTELAAKHIDVDFIKIDVDELMDVSRQFKVHAMPTFVFIKRGKEVDRVMGAKKEELQRKIENHRTFY